MSNELDPLVDQWYRHLDKGEMLRVVAVDPAARLIEIQDFDGDIEELDFDAWRDMDIDLAEAPEDWTGPYDDIETDDLGYTETAMTAQDWRTPLDALRTDDESWQDARPPDERVEEEEGRPTEPYLIEEDSIQKQVQ
jgi:hypothetical protein